MSQKAPGQRRRTGMSMFELSEMFPTEASAVKWFEARHWPDGRQCGHCGSRNTREASHKSMPYWCTDCRSYFSARTGTSIAHSRVPMRKWVFAIHLHMTSLKGVSSMQLHRDIGVTQSTAWFMLQRIRKAFDGDAPPFRGPVEVDETFVGGQGKTMSNSKALWT